jgi:hypothetical protein
MEEGMPKDVELSDRERQIIADIERHEDGNGSRRPWTRRLARGNLVGAAWAWVAIVAGTAVMVVGLAANLGLMPFLGFVVLLAGVTRVSERFSTAGGVRRRSAERRPTRSRPAKPGGAA